MDPFSHYLMLYQTQNPHFFTFNTFASISLPAANANSVLASSSVEEMECGESCLETSFRKEMAPKSYPLAVSDDFLVINTQNVEDDFVNGFFDFSNDDGFNGEAEPQEKKANNSVAPKQDEQVGENDLEPIINFEDFGPVPGELVLPAHDVENLEWLSHFVEDSFKEYSTPFSGETSPAKGKEKVAETEPPVLTNTHVNAPVPAKARRSKRVRSGVRVWSVGSPASSDSSSSSSSGSSGLSSPWFFYSNAGSFSSPQATEKPKKQKKKSVTQMVSNGPGIAVTGLFFVRRCCHCGVQKTPQWRTGPLGAKSLCNACGVRYKSGRLLPEYRPACSPTFSSEKHSNHHRKVLEMRRKKGLLGQLEPGYAQVPVRIY